MVLHAHVGLRGETCLFVQMYGQYRRSNLKIKNNLGFHFLPSNKETFKILLFSKNLQNLIRIHTCLIAHTTSSYIYCKESRRDNPIFCKFFKTEMTPFRPPPPFPLDKACTFKYIYFNKTFI